MKKIILHLVLTIAFTFMGTIASSDPITKRKIDSLNSLSWKIKQSDIKMSFELASEAEKLSLENSYQQGLQYAAKNLSALYIFKGQYDSALIKSNYFLSTSIKLSDSAQIANAYNIIGSIFYYRGELDAGIENYLKALNLKEKLGDIIGTAKMYNNISTIYIGQNNFKKSLEYNLKSISIKEKLLDSVGLASSYNNIGFAYRKLGNYDTALIYSKKGLNIINNTNDKLLTSSLYSNTAEIYYATNELDSALTAFLKCIEISKELEEKRTIIYGYLGVGKVYMAKEDKPTALPYLEIGNKLAKKINAKQEIMDSYGLLSQAYANSKEYLKAYKNHLLFSQYKDSIINADNLRSIEELEQKYESDKQQNTIRLLELEKTFQETIFKRQRIIGLVLILIVLIVGWLALSLSKNNKTKKEAIKELDKKNKKLTELDEEKNHLISVVAHDLRSPLSNIIGLVGVINLDNDNLNSEQKLFTKKISESAEKLNEMIAKILNRDNIESGELDVNINSYEVNEIIKKVVSSLEQKAESKNIKIHNLIKSKIPRVLMDEDLAFQVFTNLISNAIKFSPKGLNIYLETKLLEGVLEIHIRDEGPGIVENDMNKLFGRYQRLTASPTAGEPSTGLGLSIVKHYMEAMQGTVYCISKAGKGASFITAFKTS